MDYLSFILCLLLAWIIIHFLHSTITKHHHDQESNPNRLPPGPPTLPIFGNLLILGQKPHITLTKLANTYGPLMTLQLGQVPTVVISSAVIAKEVFQKHDIFLSNRWVLDGACAMDHHKHSIVWLPVESPQWRKLRKVCNSKVFSSSKIEKSENLRKEKVRNLLDFVQERSENGSVVDIAQVAFTTTINLLYTTFFSVDLGDHNSEIAREFKNSVRRIMEELGKPNIADYFPVLKKIDPQGIRRRTSVRFQKLIELFNSMIHERMQGKRPSGSIQRDEDVLDALLGNNQVESAEMEPSEVSHLLLDLFTAGADTTSNTLEWAMAELLRNPEKLKKAQAELEDIIGKANPLEEPDISQLPYLQAVVKETFRLHPPAPFLVPRKANSDVKISNFTVPKNAQVLVNIWAIGRDPDLWDSSNSFEPERFLESDIDVKGRDYELIPFGAGRRICPGMPFAMRIIHLMLGSLIHRFDWKLEGETPPENMDMEEKIGITLERAHRLRVIPVFRV